MAYIAVQDDAESSVDAVAMRTHFDSVLERAFDFGLLGQSDHTQVVGAIFGPVALRSVPFDEYQRSIAALVLGRSGAWASGMSAVDLGLARNLVPHLAALVVKSAILDAALMLVVNDTGARMVKARARSAAMTWSWERRQARIDRSGNLKEYMREQRALVDHGKREMRWVRDQMALEARRAAGL